LSVVPLSFVFQRYYDTNIHTYSIYY
jgi:hypothetical protein